MHRFEDRTPLWDYSDNSAPDENYGRSSHWDRARAEEAARTYVAAEEGEENRYRTRGYRDPRYGRERGQRTSAGYGRQAQRAWSAYEAPPQRDRYYDAPGEARGGYSEPRSAGWPSELGYPAARGYSPYGQYPQAPSASYDPDERGFVERAGDELRSWFGDREARRRRELDHRGRGPKNYIRSDERIREDVNDRLTEDVWLDASEIEVAVADGEVTLSGTVEDRRSKRRAEDCVDDVTGVKHVQNNLRYASGVVSPTIE